MLKECTTRGVSGRGSHRGASRTVRVVSVLATVVTLSLAPQVYSTAGAASSRCSLITKGLVKATLGFKIYGKELSTKEGLVTTCSVSGAKSSGLTLSFSSPVPTDYVKTLATSSALDGGSSTLLKGIGSAAYWDVIPSGGKKSHELLFQKGTSEVTIISSATEKKQESFAIKLASLL